jgi:DNA-binding MarR family transcriptional regulator
MVASVAVTRGMDRDSEAASGLPLAEHHLLAVLGEAAESGVRPTDLALASTLTKSGLTRAVDRLEAEGLIERRVCPSDGRGQLIALTAKGRRTLRRAAPEWRDARDSAGCASAASWAGVPNDHRHCASTYPPLFLC